MEKIEVLMTQEEHRMLLELAELNKTSPQHALRMSVKVTYGDPNVTFKRPSRWRRH